MPLYDFLCANCQHTFEETARVAERVAVCPACNGPADRRFSPTAQVLIPARFRLSRHWHLPPKGDPAWEKMVAPGSVRPEQKQTPTLREEFRKAGLL